MTNASSSVLHLLPSSLQVLYETSSDEEDGEDVEGVGGNTGQTPSSDGLVDLEDIGGMMSKMKSVKQQRREEEEAVRTGKIPPREMVTPMLRKALTKQGWCLYMYVVGWVWWSSCCQVCFSRDSIDFGSTQMDQFVTECLGGSGDESYVMNIIVLCGGACMHVLYGSATCNPIIMWLADVCVSVKFHYYLFSFFVSEGSGSTLMSNFKH